MENCAGRLATPTANGSRHAILVGTKTYDELNDLRCSEDDVHAMQEVLLDEAVGGFDEATTFLTGASSQEVLEHAETLLTETAADGDTVLLYFSGHGLTDAPGALHLAVKGTRKDALADTAIPVATLLQHLGDSPVDQALLIFDCCFSGNVRGSFRALAENSLGILASSGDEQLSYEGKEGEQNSVFTRFLVDGLATGNADLDNDGQIHVDEVYRYTRNLVAAAATLPQNPMYFAAAERELLLGRNRNYRPIDLSQVPPEQLEKFLAVKQMVELLRQDPAPVFGLGTTRYFIEGEPVRATMLTVSPGHTPNAVQTQTGFETDAFFAPDMLSPTMLAGKEVFDGRAKVRLEMRLEDIWMVAGALDGGEGPQISLYMGTPQFPSLDDA